MTENGSPLEKTKSPFSTIDEAIEDFRNGRMVVIVDSEDRENEGDVCVPAQLVTPEHITFMAIQARGLICLTMSPEKIDRLGLEMMSRNNGTIYDTAFTVSIEAREGVTTGISAEDRAHTIRVAAAADAKPDDIITPGHMFPLRARPNGVLERTGQTEGSVDLARMAGLESAAVICEIMNDDGTMARVPDLEKFCAEHDLKMISIDDMIEWRLRHESQVEKVATADLPTKYGDFVAHGFASTLDDSQHVALVKGDIGAGSDVLVRVHSACCTGDVFGSLRCDCGEQFEMAMNAIEAEGRGVLLYLAQEGRGIGLLNKLKAYGIQQQRGLDTVDANLELGFDVDLREFGIAAQMLRNLGVTSIRLMTNNPAKMQAIEKSGIDVVERVALETVPNRINAAYLQVKRDRLGHLLTNGMPEDASRNGLLAAVTG